MTFVTSSVASLVKWWKTTEMCLLFVYRHLKRGMLLSCCGAHPPGNSYKRFHTTVWPSLRWPSPQTHACSSLCPGTAPGHCGDVRTVDPMLQVKKVLPCAFTELGQFYKHEVSLYDHSVHIHHEFQIPRKICIRILIAYTTYFPVQHTHIYHIHLVLKQEEFTAKLNFKWIWSHCIQALKWWWTNINIDWI